MPITKYYEVDILGEIRKFTEEQLLTLRNEILSALPIDGEVPIQPKKEESKMHPPSVPITGWYKDKDIWRSALHGSISVSVVNEVYSYIKDSKTPLNVDELCTRAGISTSSVRKTLYILLYNNAIYESKRGTGINTKNVYGLKSSETIIHNDEVPKIDVVPEGTEFEYPSLRDAYEKNRDAAREK